MRENNESNLIDAAVRFEQRRQLEVFPEVFESTRELSKLIGDQVNSFSEYLNQSDSVASQLFDQGFESGFKAAVIESDGEDIAQDGDYAVYYASDKLKPMVLIDSSAIGQMSSYIDPLFSSIEIDDYPLQKARLATVSLSWMALSKWLFNELDPRQSQAYDTEEYSKIRIELCKLTGITGNEIDDTQYVESKIDGIMSLIRCRIMGSLAFVGMKEYISDNSQLAEELTGTHIDTFKQLCVAFGYRNQVDANNFSIMEYAMLHPLREATTIQSFKDLSSIYGS